jgi:peroxygenase
MTFDNEGRYVPQNFENIFSKYDKEGKGGLTWSDVLEMARGQRQVFDFFGWNATMFECTFDLCSTFVKDGIGHT